MPSCFSFPGWWFFTTSCGIQRTEWTRHFASVSPPICHLYPTSFLVTVTFNHQTLLRTTKSTATIEVNDTKFDYTGSYYRELGTRILNICSTPSLCRSDFNTYSCEINWKTCKLEYIIYYIEWRIPFKIPGHIVKNSLEWVEWYGRPSGNGEKN